MHHPRQPLGPTHPPVQWHSLSFHGQSEQEVPLTTHPLLTTKLKKSKAIPLLLPLWLRGRLQSENLPFTELEFFLERSVRRHIVDTNCHDWKHRRKIVSKNRVLSFKNDSENIFPMAEKILTTFWVFALCLPKCEEFIWILLFSLFVISLIYVQNDWIKTYV
jgi:hypothetical protein